MKRYNYPTNLYFGEGSLIEGAKSLAQISKKTLLVTDATLTKIGITDKVKAEFEKAGLQVAVFDGTHSNPIEEDIEKGAIVYNDNQCDSIVALGGGSPMDAAKVIAIAATHTEELKNYDDAVGGDALIDGSKLPVIYAIPTTAGTGSEVGRCGVIVMRESGSKTIFFHPKLLPEVAILEPALLKNLPAHITAATGLDALTHSLEAYFAPGFDPMADGIALESIQLILENLKTSVQDGSDLNAREKMLMAATMGGTAFQKGLGMIHSLAHPLSSECNLHHGLANALLLPEGIAFLEDVRLKKEQRARIARIHALFQQAGYAQESLSESCKAFIEDMGVQMGLKNHGVTESNLEILTQKAFADGCHQTNMVPVTAEDLRSVYEKAL